MSKRALTPSVFCKEGREPSSVEVRGTYVHVMVRDASLRALTGKGWVGSGDAFDSLVTAGHCFESTLDGHVPVTVAEAIPLGCIEERAERESAIWPPAGPFRPPQVPCLETDRAPSLDPSSPVRQ